MGSALAERLTIAVAGKARGLRGEVIFRGEPDELALIDVVTPVYLTEDGKPSREVGVVSCADVRGGRAVRLDMVRDRTEAETLRGATLEIDADSLPEPTADWFLWRQVVGFTVSATTGDTLGRIEDRIRTGAQDVFVVRDGRREVLIPAVPEIVREVSASRREVVVELIEGLLEINDT